MRPFLSWIFTFPFEKTLGLALIEEISQLLEGVFHRTSKHLRDTLIRVMHHSEVIKVLPFLYIHC